MVSSPAPVGQSAGIWRVVAGKMYVRALDLYVFKNWPEAVLAVNGQMQSDFICRVVFDCHCHIVESVITKQQLFITRLMPNVWS